MNIPIAYCTHAANAASVHSLNLIATAAVAAAAVAVATSAFYVRPTMISVSNISFESPTHPEYITVSTLRVFSLSSLYKQFLAVVHLKGSASV